MAFDIQKNKRLAADGIEEVDSDNNETMSMVEEASKSNVIATQSWVSRVLRGFCKWTRLFHTEVLHARSEVVTRNIKSKKANIGEVYANSIILTNKEGYSVKIGVDSNGKIDIQETVWDVFFYPKNCFVREYFYLDKDDIVGNFADLLPFQTLLNFTTFSGGKTSEFQGRKCQLLCTPTDANKVVDKTLLINFPMNKVAKRLVVLGANGEELASRDIPSSTTPVRQLTINLPRFVDKETHETHMVELPSVIPGGEA